jgi:Nitrate reductase delta subunit
MTAPPPELLRALGAVADNPGGARVCATALGLAPPGPAGHTDVFVLNCPPYASIYLGPDGALGGEGTDRIAGFWRAIGLTPPAEPDHLSALLGLYASLGEAAEQARHGPAAAALSRARAALFHEHLWSWLPGYLSAVAGLGDPALAAWAQLTRRALVAEYQMVPPPQRLPLALRAAPGPPGPAGRVRALVDALTTPAATGIIITRRQLAHGAAEAGVGHRIGERRFTLRAMLEQDAGSTLAWVAEQARRWEEIHAGAGAADMTGQWWARRAAGTAKIMQAAAAQAARSAPAGAVS